MGQTKQRRLTNKVFRELEKAGFHPVDVEFGNGYFIFDHGKDMVIHFHVKELKGWKMGIWWNLDGDETFDFFTQYERDIDKFKPAASTFVSENCCEEDWSVRAYIVNMLTFIKKHPYRAWKIDQSYHREIWDWDDTNGAWRAYVKCWWKYSVIEPRFYEFLRKRYVDLVTDIANICLENPKVVDGNTDGWVTSPRYSIICDDAIGENLKHGHYGLVLKEELSDYTMKRVRRYNRQYARLSKRHGYAFSDVRLGDELMFSVKRKENQNDAKQPLRKSGKTVISSGAKSKQSTGKKKSPSKVQPKAKAAKPTKE